MWRLRALHELGTIELFDSGGTEKLSQARRTAAELGAFSTAAVLDLQLAAAYDFRLEFGESTRHAKLALDAGERLGMADLQAKALLFLAEAHAMRQELAAMEACLRQASALAPADRLVMAFGWGGCRAMSALFRGDLTAALSAFGRAAAVLAEVRRGTVTVARQNRGVLCYAEAILVGRRGDRDRAGELSSDADTDIGDGALGHLSRLLAAEPALAGGWGGPHAMAGGRIRRFQRQGSRRWSTDVKPRAGTSSCEMAHTAYVISGRMRVRMDDGAEAELAAAQQHAKGSHGADITREHILSELQPA